MNQSKQKIFEIAESQQGFFTSQQAISCGYSSSTHDYHMKRENWIREHRGIFRLAKFPYSSQTQFVVTALWTMNRDNEIDGVYSHESALVLHDVTDANPNKLYMTVPKHFRRHSKPPYEVELFKQTLKDSEVIHDRGYKITTPLRTVLDLISLSKTEERIVIQALQQFYEKGHLTKKEIEIVSEENTNPVIEKYLKESHHA